MMKILAFGASSSKKSINKAFAKFACEKVKDAEYDLVDLNDFEMPVYSVDRENETGIPEPAYHFKELIKSSDGFIISFAEHNGAYTAAFKNIYDWVSRIESVVWGDKPMFLLATSTGSRGADSVLNLAITRYKRANSNTISSFSLPSFNRNFSVEEGILNDDLLETFMKELAIFKQALGIGDRS